MDKNNMFSPESTIINPFITNPRVKNLSNRNTCLKRKWLYFLLIGSLMCLIICLFIYFISGSVKNISESQFQVEIKPIQVNTINVTSQRPPLKLHEVRVCIPETSSGLCNTMELGDSQISCVSIESRVDCAIKMARGEVDIGIFTEEETLLIAQQQPNDHRVIATTRDLSRTEPFAFEAVAIVSNVFTAGFDNLRGARYCHPGFDNADLRWSPRVLKTFEQAVSGSDRCPNADTRGRTADEMEVEALSSFFTAACRPGPWSANATVDANLKTRFPNLCSLCGNNNTCTGYSINMGVEVAGVNSNNRHIQALECLRSNGNGTVAYVAWHHVREFFVNRSTDAVSSFSIMCSDGTLQPLTPALLDATTAPCAFVRQPWGTILANSANAIVIQSFMRAWWPNGVNPGGNTWQSNLFSVVGGANTLVTFEDNAPTPTNYTSQIRNITSIDATTSCIPARRWCTLNDTEQIKCSWIRAAAHSLGIQPAITCLPRPNIFSCLTDIKADQIDFMASSSNYGYIARQHYQLSPVKLLQNLRSAPNAFSRVAAFVKENSPQGNITRFENLKGKKACFPEYGGIAYVAFVRAAQEIGIISKAECNYARAVGEFFDGACAPGAIDASHALPDDSFNATTLCTVCRPRNITNNSNFTCAWDHSNNMFFGNNGSLACLTDPSTDVVVLQTQNINAHVSSLNLNPAQYRALCRDNRPAANTGFTVEDSCLLAHVVDAEVVTRRNDPLLNAINVLLDTLELYFGYTAESGNQLINLEMYSPFDGFSDILFKDTAIGFSEPSMTTTNVHARNYIELFQHLETCTGAAPPTPGFASRNIYSLFTLIVMSLITRFVIY